jgi:hypothetical protein
MFSRLSNVGNWLRAVQQFDSGEYQHFLDTVGRFPRDMHLSNLERAMIATSNLIVGRIDDAESQFDELAKQTSASTNPNDRYINQYAFARLEGMAGDTDKVEQRARDAEHIRCKRLYRERLPIG